MTDRLDDQYLDWLYDLVGRQAKQIEHYRLMKQMFTTEFIPLVPNDDNRCMDGVAIRQEFIAENGSIRPSRNWLNEGCSVLEMVIGISRHIVFEMGGDVGEWFWHLIDNLRITKYNDSQYNERIVRNVLERLVWRKYSYDGTGGLFPLKEPQEHQAEVELWFQMESYLLEM